MHNKKESFPCSDVMKQLPCACNKYARLSACACAISFSTQHGSEKQRRLVHRLHKEEPRVLFTLLIAIVRAGTLMWICTARRTYGECQVSVWSLKLVEILITDAFLTSYCTLDNCICISPIQLPVCATAISKYESTIWKFCDYGTP